MNPLNKAVDLGCVVRLGKVFFNLEEVSFVLQYSPNLNGLTCTLGSEKFDFTSDKYYGYNFKVYSIYGKLIQEGVTSEKLMKIYQKEKLS